jgi:hypothetical protein
MLFSPVYIASDPRLPSPSQTLSPALSSQRLDVRTFRRAAFIVILALTNAGAAPQSPAVLQISSPNSGIVISPGQVVPVTVSSPTPSAFTNIIVIGQGPLGFSNIAASLPAQFSVTVPADTGPGKYNLVASGITTSGTEVDSAAISIDVERSDLPTKIAAMPAQLIFETQGETLPLDISGTFSDGSYLHLAASAYISFSSSNPSVVTVDATGTTTSIAAGNASITATYVLGQQSILVNIPVTVALPLLTASPSSLTFGNQATGTTSPAQALALTNVSNGPISVLAVGTTGDFSETDNCVSSSPLAVSAACTVNAKFVPSGTGPAAGTVDITNDFTTALISIPLSGTGTPAQSAPAITSLSPNSGTLGTAVTITGTNFGSSQGSSTVTFSGTAGTATSWSPTSIVVRVPTGATTGNVVVTVGGVASSGVTFTVQATTLGSFSFSMPASMSQIPRLHRLHSARTTRPVTGLAFASVPGAATNLSPSRIPEDHATLLCDRATLNFCR